jgi:hypothetical protein
MKSSIIAILSLASLILPATDFARAQVPPALKVQGNQLVDPSGNKVRLLGVNIAGTEYACIKGGTKENGYGFGDGPVLQENGSVNTKALTFLKGWNVNVVRVPLNEDCWLADPKKQAALNPNYTGQVYRDKIIAYVQALNAAGLYVILDLHHSAPGSILAKDPNYMADAEYSIKFWTDVATTFKDNGAVLFDLFNEPAIVQGGEVFKNSISEGTGADWDCWLNGCDLLYRSYGKPTNQPTCGAPPAADGSCQYKSAGMSQMLKAVRAAFAKQPVLVGGLFWKQDMTSWLTYAGMLKDKQIVAAPHVYCKFWGDQPACQKWMVAFVKDWNNGGEQNLWPKFAEIATSFPVVSDEIGEFDCATNFIVGYVDANGKKIQGYLDFADQNGISYLGWSYNTNKEGKCTLGKATAPFLIVDYAGTPTDFGIGLKSHLATLVPTVTAVFPKRGPPAGGTPLTVTGTNFTGARAVNFGSTAVTSFTVNPNGTSISVTSPAGAGTQDVTVTTYLATSAANANDQFTYNNIKLVPPPPTVTSVSLLPYGVAAGPTAGGTVVQINGTNLSRATAVHFGANAAASFSPVTAGVITATSPAGSQGLVDITVSTGGGTSQTSAADQFAYVDLPGFAAPISPALGPAAGGTMVTLTGTGFTYVTAVNFGGNPAASFSINSDTTITAISPHASGLTLGQAVVTVVNPAGTSGLAFAQYTYVCGSHDFNGDGMSDIAWRDASGNTGAWLMNGAQVLGSGGYGVVPSDWQIVGQRDFFGFGRCDLLWRDSSGNLAMWLLTGLLVQEIGSLGNVSTDWAVVGTSDFNGDGKGDILWKDNSGNVAIWLMNGLSILQAGGLGNVGTAWSVAGTGDFNGDGEGDILWRDSSGNLAIWLMNGLSVLQAASLGAVPGNWQIMGTGDFNGDGVTDILWQDSNTGTVAFWLLNSSTQILQMGTLGAVAAPWSIMLTGDYNGDTYSDILWRNIATGDLAIWFLTPNIGDSLQVSSAAGVGNVSTTWTIQNANAE